MKLYREMNIPNRLTVFRIVLIPFFVLFMCLSAAGGNIDGLRASGERGFLYLRWLSLIVFAVASITDLLDGMIARKKGLITDFGKFADPLADKLLVSSALVLFSAEGSLPAWVTILIIAREFVISGVRQVAATKGTVIAASKWGKLKTDTQVVLCLYLILPRLCLIAGPVVTWVLILLVAAMTLVSLADYLIKNKSVFDGCMK